MMQITTQHLAFSVWTLVVVLLTILSTIAFVKTPTCVTENPLDVQTGQSEYLQKFYDRERKLMIIRAVAANKCLVLRNNNDVNTEGRPMRISSKSFAHELAVEMFGRENIENICVDMPVHEASIIEEAYFREKRAAENETAPAEAAKTEESSGSAKAPVVFSTEEIPPEIEGTNQCQDQFLVDCGADNAGVYDCVTGPSAVYRANTRCAGATQFVFSLKPRCSEFEDTKNARFIKCLQHFIFRKHFSTPDAPVVAGGGFQGGGLDSAPIRRA